MITILYTHSFNAIQLLNKRGNRLRMVLGESEIISFVTLNLLFYQHCCNNSINQFDRHNPSLPLTSCCILSVTVYSSVQIVD